MQKWRSQQIDLQISLLFIFLWTIILNGSKCRFRHCEKAIGSDSVCSLWREGRCPHQLCKFRHMEIQQKYNSISCFWETQPLGCIRISCVFHHRKPRNINGLFLPPSCDASYLLSKTPEDIEEEKTIKEICYKSGEYYRIQTSQENHLTKIIPSVLKNEFLKPMETGRDLQEGDSIAVPSKFNTERQTEIVTSLDNSARSDLSAFENGGGDCYLPQRSILVGGIQSKVFSGDKGFPILRCSNSKATGYTESIKKHNFKGVKKKKWTSEESKNLSIPLTAKAMHTSNPKGKGNFQQNDQSKNAENASYVPSQRANGRSISLSSSVVGRSPNMTYSKAGMTKEAKRNLPTERSTSVYNIPAWRRRSSHTKVCIKAEKMYSEPRRNGSR
nr:uncharacterized protein C12orf50 homolog isoform X3 [Pogona vitticeps]